MPQNNDNELSKNSYDIVKGIADYLLMRTRIRPKIGVICGTGLSGLDDYITDRKIFEYSTIPNFPMPYVGGHGGRLTFGFLEGMPVMAVHGRFHIYDGYSSQKCSLPVRLMKLLDIEYVLATNAAGGLNPTYRVGDIMLIHDHLSWLSLFGNSTLRGPNDTRFGTRFLNIANVYDRGLIKKAIRVAKEMGIEKSVHVGVFFCVGGPSYETVAELKLMHMLGGDAVGMSTVNEVITARHCGMKVFAFGLITVVCPLDYENEYFHRDDVVSIVQRQQVVCLRLMLAMVQEIAREFAE